MRFLRELLQATATEAQRGARPQGAQRGITGQSGGASVAARQSLSSTRAACQGQKRPLA